MIFPLKNPIRRPNTALLRCISGCPGEYPLNEVIYQCPKCQDLLEVVHDIEPLRMTPADEWKDIFDSRFMRTFWPYGSGVWGKKEFVCPDVDDENVVSTCEGGSNLFWAEQLGYRWGLRICGSQCGVATADSKISA